MIKKKFTKTALYMLASTTSLAFIGLLGKLGESSFSLPSIIFWRFLFSFFLCSILLWSTKSLKKGALLENIGLNGVRAFFILGSQYSLFYYIQSQSLLNGMALLNTGSLFIPLLERFFLHKKIDKTTWLSIGICFAGALCILKPSQEIFSLTIFAGLLAGFCQGVSQTLFGLTSRSENSYSGIFCLFFFCMLFSLPLFLLFNTDFQYKTFLFPSTIPLLLALGIASVLNQLFRAAAYKYNQPSQLAVFLYFSVLLSGIFDWIIWNNPPNLFSWIGTILIIGGSLFKTFFFKKT